MAGPGDAAVRARRPQADRQHPPRHRGEVVAGGRAVSGGVAARLHAAIERAIENEDLAYAETRWSDALSSDGDRGQDEAAKVGARIVDSRVVTVAVAPERAFEPIRRIGGENGWYYAGWLWLIRGGLDRLAGGPGLRRGRRSPVTLAPGDALDFWRVEAFEEHRLLRLRAEMRVPGRAWLQFEVEPDPAGATIRQTAIFDPFGLGGLLYWYALYPLHAVIFGGMLDRIAQRARAA